MAISASTLELVAARAGEGRKARRIADDVVAALDPRRAFCYFTPAAHGGREGRPQDFFLDRHGPIAERDMSTAWALGIVAVHNFQIAMMDPARAANAVCQRAGRDGFQFLQSRGSQS